MTSQLIDGRFQLETLASSGGMGSVYRARDLTTGAPVAVKLLLEEDADSVARFARETMILAAMAHPAIVRHVAHGHSAPGRPYLVMAWLDGEEVAADSGVHHLGHVAGCIAVLLDARAAGCLIDDRPSPGPAAALIDDMTAGGSV
ncbi:MAG: hypothetical protein NT062_23265 [Proteobacteria bacterium]|nr:hypothetical protein [Pseudomonadota bacterium]